MKSRLMKTEEMPRISRQELGENLDLYLERVEKENIGFVITDEGKSDLVLCPAWWFGYSFDETFQETIVSAVSGAIRGNSESASKVAEFVKKNLDFIEPKTLGRLNDIISTELLNPNKNFSSEIWKPLLADILESLCDIELRIQNVKEAKSSDSEKVDVTVSIDEEILANSKVTLVKLGLTLDEAIQMFLAEMVKRQRIPFEPWGE